MNYRHAFLFFFLVFLLGMACLFPAAAQNVSDIVGDSFEETDGRGLLIRTRPAGAKVFIDGIERGQTPLSIENIQAGEYHIRLSKEGIQERMFKVTLSEKSRLLVGIEMKEALGTALIMVKRAGDSPPENILPLNMQIFVDSTDRIYMAFAEHPSAGIVPDLTVGRKMIRVRAFGWEDSVSAVLIQENQTTVVNITMKPAVFGLSRGSVSRKSFNPKNSGSLGQTEFNFEVSAPGSGILRVLDSGGSEVYRRVLDPFRTWSQQAAWNGRGQNGLPLPEGIYTALIEASGNKAALADNGEALPDGGVPAAQSISLRTEIDYSLDIFPLSLGGGVSGLALAPLPAVLPRGSFQIEADILFGSFSPPELHPRSETEQAFARLPFEAGLRFAPFNRFEFAAVLNANPKFDGKAGWGFTGAAKFNVLSGSGDIPLGLGAGLSWAWAGDAGEAPQSPGRGLNLWLPCSLELGQVSIAASAGMRWPGPKDPVPRLLLSTGALYRGSWHTAGLSLRPEFDFTNTGNRAGLSPAERVRLLAAAEARFYPPPSNLVFSLLAGLWFRGEQAGSYGGLGVGLLY